MIYLEIIGFNQQCLDFYFQYIFFSLKIIVIHLDKFLSSKVLLYMILDNICWRLICCFCICMLPVPISHNFAIITKKNYNQSYWLVPFTVNEEISILFKNIHPFSIVILYINTYGGTTHSLFPLRMFKNFTPFVSFYFIVSQKVFVVRYRLQNVWYFESSMFLSEVN